MQKGFRNFRSWDFYGAMLLEIASKAKIPLRLYGIDNSASMLEFAQKSWTPMALRQI